MKDIRQTPNYARFMEQRGWIVHSQPVYLGGTNSTSSSIYIYIRYFPFVPLSLMKIQRFEVLPEMRDLKYLVRKYHVFYVTLEPETDSSKNSEIIDNLILNQGFRKSRDPFLPTKSIRLSLRKNKRQIFIGMKKDCQSSIYKAEHWCRPMIIKSFDSQIVDRWYQFWKKYGKGYIPNIREFTHLIQAFSNRIYFVFSTSVNDGVLLAGAVILMSDKIAYYYYAATSPTGRRYFAGYQVVWNAILEAKYRGCSCFDLEGIYDPRFPQLKRWLGFSMFKKKFGGKEVIYPGIYTRYYFPW